MEALPVILVDDEKLHREVLAKKIAMYCPELKVVAECATIAAAIAAIEKYEPKILFLDIEMGNASVFDWLNETETNQLNIIFVTGQGNLNNMQQALQVRPYGFVHKPIVKEQLIEAVQKAVEKIKSETPSMRQIQHQTIILYNKSVGNKKVMLGEIVYIESNGHILCFHFSDGNEFSISGSLEAYEIPFAEKGFCRVQRSYLINTVYIDILKDKEKIIILKHYPNIQIRATRDADLWKYLKEIGME